MAKNTTLKSAKKRSAVDEFIQLGVSSEGILRAEQVPCMVPLLLWDLEEVESKFAGSTLRAQCAVEESEGGEVHLVKELKDYEAEEALEEVERRVAAAREAETLTQTNAEVPQRAFRFFLPKRMQQGEEERKEINKHKYLGMVAGLKAGKSLCLVLQKLESKRKGASAAKKKRPTKEGSTTSKQAEVEISSEAEED
uniref:Uncharacterized protein n=1 Tax=Vesanto virus TaxID=1955786 RepID=A0A7D4ZYM2_9VIRU|nr:hypothetical protein 2 [Vesanto virus]